MDRSFLLDQLILIGARQLLRQQSIIEELESRGEDSRYARSFLCTLQEIQAMRLADRDRSRGGSSSSSPTSVDRAGRHLRLASDSD